MRLVAGPPMCTLAQPPPWNPSYDSTQSQARTCTLTKSVDDEECCSAQQLVCAWLSGLASLPGVTHDALLYSGTPIF